MPGCRSGARPVMPLPSGLPALRGGRVACRDFPRRIGGIGVPWVREVERFLIGRVAQQQAGEIPT